MASIFQLCHEELKMFYLLN
uniref:Uncharacterized protein n=1 Tax=Rhizophora mucronata TaxID=61149 RepID=A0A2P2LDJ6_RHIMU